MFASSCRYGVGVGFLIALLSQAPAQDKEPPPMKDPKAEPKLDPDDYRLYFKKPVTLRDFWDALHFEIDVGRFDLAARHLAGLLEKSTDVDALLQLENDKGMAAFLRLQNIPRWSEDPKANAQAKKDAEELVKRVTAALKDKLSDPKRIDKFVKNLSASPEERAFALRELYRSGPAAVPRLVEVMRTAEAEERVAILTALPRLRDDTVTPLVAALEIDDPQLRVDLIDVLQKRRAVNAVPHLWYLADSTRQPEGVRKKAKEALAYFLDQPVSKLPPARQALTREAERYYHHKVRFPDPEAVGVWRWDGKELTRAVMLAGKAEEHYGLLFARQALDIDPAYQPAQEVFLSLALEKAAEQAPGQPLAKSAPKLNELLVTVSPDLVTAVLERGLTDQRTPVVLGAVRALGELAEVRAARPTTRGEPALVRALNYPDRRVQMAAAEALLQIPGTPSAGASTRVVEVLRRALAGDAEAKAGPKVLVAFANPELGNRVGKAVAGAGYDPVSASTGRDALRRLNEAADVDALLIDAALPDPGLNSLLAQLRADVNVRRLPLLLAALPDREEARRLEDLYREELRLLGERKIAEKNRLQEGLRTLAERYRQDRLRLEDRLKQVSEYATFERQQIRDNIAALPERQARERAQLEDALRTFDQRQQAEARQLEETWTDRYGAAARRKAESLRRLAGDYRNVWVVAGGVILDADGLKRLLAECLADAGTPPLSNAERGFYTERALIWLARMARGEVQGYDIRPAADTILAALRAGRGGEQGQFAALLASSRLPGAKPQSELAGFILDPNRPAPLRFVAANELVRHIQQNGVVLPPVQIKALQELQQAEKDPDLKAGVSLIIGSLRPDARQTGERLKEYTPTAPAPQPPPPEKEK